MRDRFAPSSRPFTIGVELAESCLSVAGYVEPASLAFNARIIITVVPDQPATWPEPTMQLREELFAGILVRVAIHMMHPGSIQF